MSKVDQRDAVWSTCGPDLVRQKQRWGGYGGASVEVQRLDATLTGVIKRRLRESGVDAIGRLIAKGARSTCRSGARHGRQPPPVRPPPLGTRRRSARSVGLLAVVC